MALKFILVYFVITATVVSSDSLLDLTASKIEMTPNNTIQYLKFEDLSFNLTDFTICTWIKLLNFTHTQTIIRLTGNKKEPLLLWRIHVHPKETMRVTIKNRLVASEGIQLTRGQWHHVCFQWKGFTGVWATFVNAKIHSVGQVPVVSNDTMSSNAWKLNGSGAGLVGDDSAPCRNGWQAYGLYLAGPATTTTTTTTTVDAANATGKPPRNSTAAASRRTAKNNSKRQAVFESDPDDTSSGGGGSGPSKSFQWFSKTFAFIKRMFTFVIIPFFKFVRDTFFQTRSLDDTVVDVSETHLTVSDIKYEPAPSSAATVAVAASGEPASNVDDGVSKVNRRSSSSSSSSTSSSSSSSSSTSSASKRETDDDSRCGGGARAGDDRVTAADLVAAAGSGTTVAVDDALSPNAKRYLRMVSDGLNDVGVNAAFVKRAFACCGRGPFDPRADMAVIDWDRTRAHSHDVIVSPHVCGRY